ncbi:gluconate 2-dehydrogenase subunit 3 family protein [Tsuneonella sp. CC-YZS046]|uniref:gluconate 2-dehydrogenase subunit 3 family protein n=1 Tax=Tsuneonella sp. CC-YZS046 TaxID=3042152 RepID=UPI002D7A280B|nr:gluconate 2-dehydrogenase subunit 3 family protein [Tsuneonella sp. CC-YZS046]WRO66774.1 gluconate 2-dehydrogenase subunit 3 family protein [Tsuneonella sp. CC-YZS046]
MRTVDRIDVMSRRNFIGRSAGTAALLAASPVISGKAHAAEALKTAPASAMPALVRMARDLYPHDRLPDSIYEIAVAIIDEQLAGDADGKVTLGQGVGELDAAASALKGVPYLSIAGEQDRVEVLKSLEKAGSPFFGAMRSSMITALYNQEEIWANFGYEGSSAEKGGYLHRGFDDLDWLPA